MGVKAIRCLIFAVGLLYSVLAKESEDGLFSNPDFKQSSTMMPEKDVVTPITTVPVINPTITPSMESPNYNPFPTTFTPTTPTLTPSTNPYSTPAMVTPTASSGQSWCVASQTTSQTALQVALDYACGYGGADCSAIQKGRSCFDPDTLRDHASYAFNNYYQKNPIPTSCDFGGTAVVTNVDPSTSTCHYPSISTSSSVLNTSNPTGSTVFGSVPPATSGTIMILNDITFLLIHTCLLVSMALLSIYRETSESSKHVS